MPVLFSIEIIFWNRTNYYIDLKFYVFKAPFIGQTKYKQTNISNKNNLNIFYLYFDRGAFG